MGRDRRFNWLADWCSKNSASESRKRDFGLIEKRTICVRLFIVYMGIAICYKTAAFEINQDTLVGDYADELVSTYFWTNNMSSRTSVPVHELWLDISVAEAANSSICPVEQQDILGFIEAVPTADVSGYLCCGKGSDSRLCRRRDSKRQRDLNSLRRGVTWNDNPCHLSRLQYGPWAGLPRRYSRPNLSIRSHRGELQFLHAMASGGELADETLRAMRSWAEFGYLVAAGDIDPNSKLGAAFSQLSSESHEELLRRFGQDYAANWSVGLLFTGVFRNPYPDRQIQLLALGSVIHMLQDSYSDSHVWREPRQIDAGRRVPTLEENGAIVSFRTFLGQSIFSHLSADNLPYELEDSSVLSSAGDLPPVVSVADLIACAVSDATQEGESLWPVVDTLLIGAALRRSSEYDGRSAPRNGEYD